MTIQMMAVSADKYESACGCYVMQREYGKTPQGNNMNGRWVLRKGAICRSCCDGV